MGIIRLSGFSRRLAALAVVAGALLVAAFGVSEPVQAAAGINQQINFQGRLLNAQGATVADGYYNVQFKIYQDGTGTTAGNPGGTLKWTETYLNSNSQGVRVTNGFLSVQLGSLTSLSGVDWNQDTLWLSMNIANTASCTPFSSCSPDGEMLPMKRMSANAYAMNAGNANTLGGLTSAGFIQNGTNPQTADFNISGTGTIGGGASISGGLNNNNGGITNTGAIAGATTIAATTSVHVPMLQNAGTLTIAATGANSVLFQTNGTTRLTIDSAGNYAFGGGNFTGVGTITSGTINGQTIGSSASFTGTVTAATSVSAPVLISTVATGTAPLTVSSTTLVNNLNSQYLNGVSENQLSQNLRAGQIISGGGTIGYNGSGVTWSDRMVLSTGLGSDASTEGFFSIYRPTNGTVITGVGGAGNATVSGDHVPLAANQGLYYILPIGSGNATVNANFRVASFTSAQAVPFNWVPLAVQNSDNNTVRFTLGHTLRSGQTATAGTINNATFNTSVTTSVVQSAGSLTVAASGNNSIVLQTNGQNRVQIDGAGLTTFYGGIGNSNSGITDTGALSGVTNLTASGNINTTGGYQFNGTSGTSATCTSGEFLQNAVVAGGIVTEVSCAAVTGDGGVTVIGTLDGQPKSANGAAINGNTLHLQTADATYGGIVSNAAQTFAGAKTFNNGIILGGTGINVGSHGISNAGAISGVTTITASGTISGSTLTSTVATGTAPLTVASTTKVDNLNADLLDGLDSTAFAAASGSANYIQNGTAPQAASFNVTGTGTIGGGATITSGASISGGLNNNAGNITNAGNISGADTIGATGNITSTGGVLTMQGAGTNSLTGNLTIGGTLAVTGTQSINNTNPVYRWMTPGGTDLGWKTIANIVVPTGQYQGVGFQVDVLNNNGNAGSSITQNAFKFFVAITRSGAVQDDTVAALLSGPVNDYIRVVKASNAAYELQVKQNVNYQNVMFTAQVTGGTGAVTYVTAPVTTGTAGTAYTPNVSAANFANLHVDYFTNASVTGNLALGGNITASAASTWSTSTGSLTIQAAGTNTLLLDTGGAGTVNLATANATTVSLGNNNATTSVLSGATMNLGANGVNKTINIGAVGTTANTTTLNLGTSTAATQTVNIGSNSAGSSTTINGTTVVVGSGASAASGQTTIQSKSNVYVTTNGTIRATFGNNNILYLGNGGSAAAPNSFLLSATNSSATGVAGADLSVQGGNGTVGNANGGNLNLNGGNASGTGANGLVVISTPTFATSANDANCFTGGNLVTTSCTFTATTVNGSSAALVGFNTMAQTATLPDPTILTAGRVIYVTAANGSNDFTLLVNGGGQGNSIAMRQNTTATMIWNGSDWTAAGASSSTTLQSAYDNTLQSAGGAELIVSKTSTTNGLTIRDSSVNEVKGTLISVQTASAASLFSVNSNVTEYARNAGAETAGSSAATFPASTWTVVSGATITRNTDTSNNSIATGQGSVQVATPNTANAGVQNVLSTTLTANSTYNVSFAARLSSGTFTDMNVYYSINGTAASVPCVTGQAIATSVWTKVNCTFTAPASGITTSNAILIRQTTGAVRTFYVDNLSVTIAADFNYATDGNVNDQGNFASNWQAVTGGGTVSATRDTSLGYNASDSARAQITTATAGAGIRNKLSINPLATNPGTPYRITVYASSSTAMSDLTIRYSRNGGTNFVNCVDYSSQSLSGVNTDFKKITCYITPDSTAATDPWVYFTQGSGAARNIYIDAFSMTLASDATPNVQIGGGTKGGPTTLFTLDKGASAPIASNNDALLGSMYYDTSLGKLQCYEADGWGACGSSPDNVVTISPEYTNAVMHGTGVGTMTSDICSDTLNINDGSSSQPTICGTNETYNFYKWTSPQPSAQNYGIYVTYQLPTTFKEFASGQSSLMGRTDSANSTVSYQIYRSDSNGLTACGSGETVSTGAQTQWQVEPASGAADPSTCGFQPGNSIVFKINVTASGTANAYVGNLNFTFSNR